VRFVLLGALVALVTGCVLPPAVTIGSYAADGLSYLITGKSVTDHALSEVVGEDCATWRLIKLENPCRPYEDDPDAGEGEDGGVAVASSGDTETLGTDLAARNVVEEDLQPLSADSSRSAAGWSDPEESPADVVEVDLVAPAGVRMQEADAGAPTSLRQPGPAAPVVSAAVAPRDRLIASTLTSRRVVLPAPAASAPDRTVTVPRQFFVLGSFSVAANANSLIAKHKGAMSVPTTVGGVRYHRVILPVPPGADMGAMRKRLAAAGLKGAWPIALCGAGSALAGCLALADLPKGPPSAEPVKTAAM